MLSGLCGNIYLIKRNCRLLNRLKGDYAMTEKKEVTGKFRYEQDSKRYHRFQIETKDGIVGTIYIPKEKESMPKRIVLEYADK